MKVYIVTSGEYSSYSIEAVFTDKKQAELYAAVHSDDYIPCYVETWDSDETKIDTSTPLKNRWRAEITKDGRVKSCRVQYQTIANDKDNILDYGPSARVMVTLDKDVNKDAAIKIMLDRLAAHKYRKVIELEE